MTKPLQPLGGMAGRCPPQAPSLAQPLSPTGLSDRLTPCWCSIGFHGDCASSCYSLGACSGGSPVDQVAALLLRGPYHSWSLPAPDTELLLLNPQPQPRIASRCTLWGQSWPLQPERQGKELGLHLSPTEPTSAFRWSSLPGPAPTGANPYIFLTHALAPTNFPREPLPLSASFILCAHPTPTTSP